MLAVPAMVIRRFPRGKCGLKSKWRQIRLPAGGRFPRGKRGLKLALLPEGQVGHGSLPLREAWIEIRMIPA